MGSSEFGSWGACAGEVLPSVEVCGDGIDQDCNGADDACGTPPAVTPPDSPPSRNGHVAEICSLRPGMFPVLGAGFPGNSVELYVNHPEYASGLCLMSVSYYDPEPRYRCTQTCKLNQDCPPPDTTCSLGYFCFGFGATPVPGLPQFVCDCRNYVHPDHRGGSFDI